MTMLAEVSRTDVVEARDRATVAAATAPVSSYDPLDPPAPDSVCWWTLPDLAGELAGARRVRVAPALLGEHGRYQELPKERLDDAACWIVIGCRGEEEGVVAERPTLVLAMSAGMLIARLHNLYCDLRPVT